jgi:ketosteroid isomerase-like protein
MPQENVEIVRRMWSAYPSGGLDALEEFWDEEIDWRAIEGAPDDVGPIRGRKAMRHYYQDWLDMFEDLTTTPTELIDLGDDRVLALLHVTARARLSGIETDLRLAVVYTLRDCRIVRGREYADRDQALEAVGLAE